MYLRAAGAAAVEEEVVEWEAYGGMRPMFMPVRFPVAAEAMEATSKVWRRTTPARTALLDDASPPSTTDHKSGARERQNSALIRRQIVFIQFTFKPVVFHHALAVAQRVADHDDVFEAIRHEHLQD